MKKKTCVNCGRQGYTRKDGSIGCQKCGFGIKPRLDREKALRCPFCNRMIAYVSLSGGRCSKCGYIKKSELTTFKKTGKYLYEDPTL
jgi:ribosomal protein L37E